MSPRPLASVKREAVSCPPYHRSYIRNMSTPDRLAFIERVMTLIKDKVIVPDAGTTFPLEDFKAAVAESIKPARGKKVLLVSA